jgi:hypothetical protein
LGAKIQNSGVIVQSIFFRRKDMKRIIGLFALCVMAAAGPLALVFAQNDSDPYRTELTGTWIHEKEGLTFQFNSDGTFTMSEEGEEARKAIETEQRARGETAATSVSGTYTVSKGVFSTAINMVMVVDGKSHRIRMSYKKVDADTLQIDGQNYRRVNQR